MMLRDDQIHRYSRQLLLREVGGVGQARLLAARVRILGVGRAADEAATYLAAAGVGTLVLDADLVARRGDAWVAMNGDVRITPAGDANDDAPLDLTLEPAPADDRLAGAFEAHAALLALLGAAPGFAWQVGPGALGPAAPPAR